MTAWWLKGVEFRLLCAGVNGGQGACGRGLKAMAVLYCGWLGLELRRDLWGVLAFWMDLNVAYTTLQTTVLSTFTVW